MSDGLTCPIRLVLGNLAAWVHGSCILYASPVYSPPHIVDALVSPSLPDETCTALHGVPTHFIGVLQELEKRGQTVDGGRLRTGIASGSPVPMELMKKVREKMGLEELTIAYGMSWYTQSSYRLFADASLKAETSPVSFQIVPTDPLIKRVETVGRVHPHVRAKIVDEAGNIVPVNTPGELCVAGYLLQKG
jgi:acyl-CoA synthetase (AMP-forming)/AMP-acid ligase II